MPFNKIIAAAALGLISASCASAATLTVTGVTGSWTAAQPNNVVGMSGLGSSHMSWGIPEFQGGEQSAYGFTGQSVGHTIGEDTAFDLGTFTHFNHAIIPGETGAPSISNAQLQVVVDVKLEDGTTTSVSSTFEFDHWETLNIPETGHSCANGQANSSGVNVNGCADLVTLTRNDALSETLVAGNLIYELDISGFLFNGSLLSDFWTPENATNSAVLMASFTNPPAPIPLPAAGFLLLGSVAGLGALARRRRKG